MFYFKLIVYLSVVLFNSFVSLLYRNIQYRFVQVVSAFPTFIRRIGEAYLNVMMYLGWPFSFRNHISSLEKPFLTSLLL